LRGLKFQQTFPLDPTEPQAVAIDRLKRAIKGDGGRFLLYGVTGSGKTEVYLQAAQAALDAGKGVIVLVPEIALTPQNLERLAGRFAGNIALLHSGLSEGERFDQWWALHQGKYRIALGSRGAVFAPMDDVGLVIVDEEHEWTYKQHDAAPRYHARTVAEKLCEITGATLLAGSATPDVETFRRSELGEYERLTLPERVGVAGFSPVETAERASVMVVDMRNELRDGNAELFSRALQSAMGESLSAGDRVILFLNRRGAASHVQCRNCGYVRRCNRCDTALTYHRGGASDVPENLVCHHCSRRIRYTNLCPGCSERRLLPSGSGTQSVVDEVSRLFPGSGVLRWDRDVARTAQAHSEVLTNFLAGGNQVLVGTQMVAKGLDIPSVGLVGVVSADTGLSIPDFRAGERAFQILTQVAGRAGRGTDQGRAIIQTFQPEHYAVVNAASQDFGAFYQTELELRRQYANPPFTRLIRLGFSDPDPDVARLDAMDLAASLGYQAEIAGGTPSVVIGPAPSFPTRVRGRTRWHIIIKGSQPELLLDRTDLPAGWTVDVDPISVS
jgi:primosomal protein N' (replication factor Y)